MSRRVQFSTLPTREKRIHYVDADDVRVVLSRLPDEVKTRLLAVKFNDRSRGARTLGYVNRGRREIALCALPPRVSLTRSLVRGQSPRQFGATRGKQWPALAVRRYMLYDVLLHELGHLQILNERAKSVRRKFAMETRAEEFATKWRKQLWAKPFDHPDPAHNPPTAAEFTDSDPELSNLLLRTQQRPNDVNLLQKLERLYLKRRKYQDAKEALDKAIAINPRNPWTNLYLGNWYYFREQFTEAINYFTKAIQLLPKRAVGYWALAEAYEAAGEMTLAGEHFRKAVEVEPSDKLAKRKFKAWQAYLSEDGNET